MWKDGDVDYHSQAYQTIWQLRCILGMRAFDWRSVIQNVGGV